MKYKTAAIIYFSPTGTTRKYVREIAKQLEIDRVEEFNITYPDKRTQKNIRISTDMVIFGFPVYEEFAPEIFTDYLHDFVFEGQFAICLSVYGKIGFGMSLRQMFACLSEMNLKVLTMGAFIGEHSFSTKQAPLAKARPDSDDLSDVKLLTADFINKANTKNFRLQKESVPGHLPLMARILPKNSARMFTKTPDINGNCTRCQLCIKKCPVNAIDERLKIDETKCLRCFACVKKCSKSGREIKYKRPVLVKFMFRKNERRQVENLII